LGHHRFEWLYVTGFVEPASGRTVWNISNSICKDLFEAILADFARSVGAGARKLIVLQLDNAGWHGPENLKVPDGLNLVFQPAHSPQLQPAERLWEYVDVHGDKQTGNVARPAPERELRRREAGVKASVFDHIFEGQNRLKSFSDESGRASAAAMNGMLARRAHDFSKDDNRTAAVIGDPCAMHAGNRAVHIPDRGEQSRPGPARAGARSVIVSGSACALSAVIRLQRFRLFEIRLADEAFMHFRAVPRRIDDAAGDGLLLGRKDPLYRAKVIEARFRFFVSVPLLVEPFVFRRALLFPLPANSPNSSVNLRSSQISQTSVPAPRKARRFSLNAGEGSLQRVALPAIV